jgi:phytoene synthase
MNDLPAAQRLALAYAPARSRSLILALLRLDGRLAAALRGSREPLAAQLRLAWWRDMLARPLHDWPTGEPLLEALRGWRRPSGLVPLVDGWEALLSERLAAREIAEFVDGRGRAFACLAEELGVEGVDDAAAAAHIWALADLAAHISVGAERDLVIEYGRRLGPPPRLSATLRPLAVLAALGAAALARGGGELLAGPGSALLALRTGLTGR